MGLWDPVDRFYYDVIRVEGGPPEHLRVRSFVGLIPLFAALVIEPGTLERLPHFRRRMEWYLKLPPDALRQPPADDRARAKAATRLLTLADRDKLEAVVPRLLDPVQFLSDYGLRSMSRGLADEPYVFNGARVVYEPGESSSPIYGGNSNWRGPIWFPVNYLMVQALREYHRYYGSSLAVELPRWSRMRVTLEQAADEIARRLVADLPPRSRRPPAGAG